MNRPERLKIWKKVQRRLTIQSDLMIQLTEASLANIGEIVEVLRKLW